MRCHVLLAVLGSVVGLLMFDTQVHAQYKYTDDKGVTKTTQYRVDVPERYRDVAVWVGPTGIGKPGLSEEQRQIKLRNDAYRRIGETDATLGVGQASPRKPSPSKNSKSYQQAPDMTKPMAEMCIAGEQRVMTSPGHWQVVGACHSGFSR